MKLFKRSIALLLALTLCLGVTALAAGTETENKLATIEVQTLTAGNATVKFYADPVTGEVADKEERIVVTYTNKDAITAQGQYLILMVTGDGSDIGEDDEILYINQVTDADDGAVDGTIAFEVYPSQLKSGAILITGTGITPTGGKLGLIAAIIEGKYLLGDVDGNGTVNMQDAMQVGRFAMGLSVSANFVEEAAYVKAGAVNMQNAMLVGRFAMKLIDKFPVS